MAHGHEKVSRFPMRRMDVLWKTRRDLVDKEILRLKDEEGHMNSAFELRTTASKNVMNGMSQEELKELDNAAANMEKNGYSEEHKRRLVHDTNAMEGRTYLVL